MPETDLNRLRPRPLFAVNPGGQMHFDCANGVCYIKRGYALGTTL